MIPLLDNAVLASDLDVNNFYIRNPGMLVPAPPGILDTTDPRLSDQRNVPAGSVTDDSVSATAAIQQSKLLFNGAIPPAWLGTGNNQAARGDLAERVAGKNANGGYAGLDSNGQVLASKLPALGPGAGTVTDLKLQMPPDFSVSGLFTVAWQNAPNNSWFGVNGPVGLGGTLLPTFKTTPVPANLVPSLSATKFTTGSFGVDKLPLMAGMGVGHAKGLVTDPGQGEGNVTDYLGRDAKWRSVNRNIAYQPTLPTPSIAFAAWDEDLASIRLSDAVKGCLIFYHIESMAGSPILTPYAEVKNPSTISVAQNFTILAYAAKAGWNNSEIISFTVPVKETT